MKQSLDCRGLAYLPKKWRGNRIGHLTYPLNLSEPTGCCPCEFLLVRSRLRGPGDDTIGAHQDCAQAQLIDGIAGDIGNPAVPAACQRFKRCIHAKIQKQTFALSQKFAGAPPVRQCEVRNASAHQRIVAA